VSLNWTASSGATSYNIYRGTSAGGENKTAVRTGIAGPVFTDSGLANGTKYFYKVAAVNAGVASGLSNEASATPTASVTNPAPPTADSVSGAVAGSLSQTLTFSYSSVNGYGWLSSVRALLNREVSGSHACYIEYVPSANGFYLLADGVTAQQGPLTPGAAGTLANGQCTLQGAGSSVSGSGNTLRMTLNLTLASSFGAVQNIYMYDSDFGGLASGWQLRGTMAASTPPTADSVSGAVAGSLSQTLTFSYSSVNGYGWLSSIRALLNREVTGSHACYIEYVPSANGFYLLADGVTAQQGPLTPGSAGTLANGQCTLQGAGSSVSGSGNTLQMTLKLTFASSYGAAQNIYMYDSDFGGLGSAWQLRGTTAANTPPTANSVSGAVAGSLSQTLTFSYSSVNGYGWLSNIRALLNREVSGSHACYVEYVSSANGFYLLADGVTAQQGPLAPGAAGTLTNGQCTLQGAGSSVSGSGNTLQMTLSLTFTSSFGTAQNIYMDASDFGGLGSGWQNKGTLTLP
jgi:hypothetical protein